MSYCFGEGCPHPDHAKDNEKKAEPVIQELLGGKPLWMKYATPESNRKDRRRAMSLARKEAKRPH